MKTSSQKITANLAINQLDLTENSNAKITIQKGINYVFACDVSGSMYGSLSRMRTQLKNRIPDLVGEKDTISIVWFSGRSQSGILKEGVKVKDLNDLQALNTAIDRFLVPMGLTAFLPPVQLTSQLVTSLGGNGNDFSFIFLSDGYNNDSAWPDVISELSKLESKVAAATFIEYGYYADSAALTEMAETIGGEKIFAKDFDSYQQDFEKIMGQKTSAKREVDISAFKSRLTYQFFFTIGVVDQAINVYSCKGKDVVLIPEETKQIYFFTQYKPKEAEETTFQSIVVLIGAYLLADRLKYKHVEDILLALGDINLINDFSGAYGKQKLNQLKDKLKEFAFDGDKLFVDGRIEGYKINPKQYCVMDLINDLQNGENFFYPYHEAFNYNRIGAKRTTKTELSEEDQKALTSAKTLKEVADITAKIETPEFVYPDDVANIGMPFNSLVWNSERANLSVNTNLSGKVKLPKNEFGLTEVPSFIYRSYTLIKDGILNVTEIPVKLDSNTITKFAESGAVLKMDLIDPVNEIYLLDISALPIINRSMATNISGKKLANLEFDLIKIQLGHKYLKNLKEQFDPFVNTESAAKYSIEAAEWLKSIGVHDRNGFSPKTETVKSGDFYVAPVLETKIEKTSTSPTVKSVLEKIDAKFFKKDPKAKDLNVMEGLMKSEIDELNPKADIDLVKKSANVEELKALTEQYNKERRQLLWEIAKIKFGVILSRTWFTEFETMEQDTLEGVKFKAVDSPLKVKFEFKEEEIAL